MSSREAADKAYQMMQTTAPAQLQAVADMLSMKSRGEFARALEGIAERAAQFARYLDQRNGAGYRDQGHEAAVTAFNKAGRIVHCKAFGYNEYRDLRF